MSAPQNTAPQAPTMPLVMNDVDAAACLGLSVHTLRKMRSAGTGPSYLRMNRSCRYRLADLHAYIEKSAVAR